MTISSQTTFVSAFFPLKRPDGVKILSAEEFLQEFKKLVLTGIKIIFFHDSYEGTIKILNELKENKNLIPVLQPLTSLDTFNLIDEARGETNIALPTNRNKPKDTIDFLSIMLSKPELIKRASIMTDSKYFAWIDAGIFKIVRNQVAAAKSILSIPQIPEDKITIPGCWQKGSSIDKIYTDVNWRFCGGFFVLPRSMIDTFNTYFNEQLKKTLSEGHITWEVNIFALMEQSNDNIFKWYQADHNDSIFVVPPAPASAPAVINEIIKQTPNDPSDVRIILLTMVKNEERIIERLIRSTLGFCDAICVCDTGSTDKTRDIVERLKTELQVPVALYQDEWKNFGHNRSLSFTNGQDFCAKLGWKPQKTYGLLLDGDMVLKVSSNFNKNTLTEGGYMVIQRNSSLDYHNTRLVRFSDNWKCVGVTHEYWDGPGRGELPLEMIHIDDIGDGGCKSDKFERDIRLLTEGLEKDPKNDRYHFYLAQSYKDTGKLDKAIEFYKKRIKLGGWKEEVWYSYYMVSKLYLQLNKVHKAEKWADKGYKFHNSRAENYYFLVKHFRERGDQYKAMHYYRLAKAIPYPKELLFVEKNIYNYLLDYEYTILHYYVAQNNKFYGTKFCLEYLNKHRHAWDNVFTNLQYYMPRLCDEFKPVKIEAICPDTDFHSSSVSLIKQPNNTLLANIRFVNYKIRPDGGYDMMENGVYSSSYWVRTLNGYQYFDPKTLKPISNLVMMRENPTDVEMHHNTNIRGLEDVRLFNVGKDLHYSATTRLYSYNGKNRIISGKYDRVKQAFTNNICMRPPTDTDCEKNWVNHEDNIIYNWHPLQVGKVNKDTKQLQIHTTHPTTLFFERVRGSSTPIMYKGHLWAVTHSVLYITPRKYYHHLVVLDPVTYKPLRISLPFAFMDTQIEYCLGFEEDGQDNFIFTFSFKDSDPHFVKVPVEWFERNMMQNI